MFAEIALAVLLIAAGLMVLYGVLLLGGLAVASIMAGIFTAVYAIVFLADWPFGGDKS